LAPTAAPTDGPIDQPTTTATATDSPQPATPSPASPVTGLSVDPADIEQHLDALQQIADDNGGIRAAGTPGYDASADYVAEQLAAMGYAVKRQPVDFTFFDEDAPVTLKVGDADWSGGEWLHSMLYGAEGQVTGIPEAIAIRDFQPTDSAGCDPLDWRAFDTGHVALVMGGTCFARDKVLLAQEAGATALILMVSTWDAGHIRRPSLLNPAAIEIPAIAVGSDPISELLDAARAGTAIELSADVHEAPATVDNVIAELPGSNGEVVMLGGHLDSVLDGPGINDNGSGVATLMAMAEAAAGQRSPVATIRFAFWAAEEFGTLGSESYVAGLSATERERIKVYLNLDMVGSPNAGRYVYATSDVPSDSMSARVTTLLLDSFEELGAPAAPAELGGGSDDVQFDVVGIPTGGVFSGLAPLTVFEAETFGGQANLPADPCYHLACDTRSNANTNTATLFGSAVAAVLEELAY